MRRKIIEEVFTSFFGLVALFTNDYRQFITYYTKTPEQMVIKETECFSLWPSHTPY